MKKWFFFLIFFSVLITSCSSNQNSQAKLVENYYQALMDKNLNLMLAQVCPSWEEQARTDYQSFAAVSAQLKDMHCTVQSLQENSATVKCQGKIEADYGNEILEIDLSKFVFKIIQENGDWRLCGYQ